MESIEVYLLDGSADKKAVAAIFSKYKVSAKQQNEKDKLLLTANEFSKTFSSTKKIEKLEHVAKVLGKHSYDKKIEKFNKNRTALTGKLNQAKDAATVTPGNMFSCDYSEGISVIDRVTSKMNKLDSNPAVAKAQAKLDKFLAKKQILNESRNYTAGSAGAVNMGQTILSVGAVPLTSKSNSIKDVIADSKNSDVMDFNDVFSTFKLMIRDLLAVTSEVGFMTVTDGNPDYNPIGQKRIKFAKLTAKDIVKTKNRELIIISN